MGCAGRGGGVGDRDDACGVTEAGPESGYKIWAFDQKPGQAFSEEMDVLDVLCCAGRGADCGDDLLV